MKKQITENIYGLIPMILVLFGLILLPGGCEKEDEYEDVLLENTKCPCEHEAAFIKPVSIKSILLFDSKVTSFNEMKAQTFDGEKSEFVAYSEESNYLQQVLLFHLKQMYLKSALPLRQSDFNKQVLGRY